MLNNRAQQILDSFKPELDIPNKLMTPQEFANQLSEYGVVCPENCIFSTIECEREDFVGDRYVLGLRINKSQIVPSISLQITMKSNLNDWSLHMVFDSREKRSDRDFEFRETRQQWLEKMFTADKLTEVKRNFTTRDETKFKGDVVYCLTDRSETVIEISPVELINAILRSKVTEDNSFEIPLD